MEGAPTGAASVGAAGVAGVAGGGAAVVEATGFATDVGAAADGATAEADGCTCWADSLAFVRLHDKLINATTSAQTSFGA